MSAMQYRKLPHGDEQISVIGLGMGSIHEGSEEEIEKTVQMAMDRGVNYFDMVASEAKPYPCYARAFAGKRDKILLQMHFGALYDGGKYGWTQDLSKIKRTFEGQLKQLHTDYTDMGFVHCIDEVEDYKRVLSSGLWDYMLSLKENGVIRHLGLSSHNPEIVRRFLDTGRIDMVMFSINPAYDYSTGTYGIGTNDDRSKLYRECEREGVGISVMKPFGGGQPCPRGIDIGLINKYYDLALAGDQMAAGHYHKLSVKADACVHCGHCEARCPFHVKQETRMKEIAAYFG